VTWQEAASVTSTSVAQALAFRFSDHLRNARISPKEQPGSRDSSDKGVHITFSGSEADAKLPTIWINSRKTQEKLGFGARPTMNFCRSNNRRDSVRLVLALVRCQKRLFPRIALS
jgi:hypothetical protein